MIEMKTKQVNKKQTVQCLHDVDYYYNEWSIATMENNRAKIEEYVDKFAEYDYDLCEICKNTEVKGLTINTWIAIEKALVWGIMVYRSKILEATKMMKENPPQEEERLVRLGREREHIYDKMEYHQEIIKQIRQAMVSDISGDYNMPNDRGVKKQK